VVLFQVVLEEPRDPGLASTRVLGRHMRGAGPPPIREWCVGGSASVDEQLGPRHRTLNTPQFYNMSVEPRE
jgi:hypothetical protein